MKRQLKEYLMLLAERYETSEFICEDPVQVPHRYTDKRDIEISALITSWIATGNRKFIIKSAKCIDQDIFKGTPTLYILGEDWKEHCGNRKSFYRYYSYHDFYLLCHILFDVYTVHDSLEDYLRLSFPDMNPLQAIRLALGQINGMPDISSSSEAKKLCMFLRWMIRRESPVDFGIWKQFNPKDLVIPLDTHVHRIATDLGLTKSRKCLKTAIDITDSLRKIWPDDPVKGDFALFGYGVNEPKK